MYSQNSRTLSDKSSLLMVDQALIPESVKKTLQSKVLMDHYQERLQNKTFEERTKLDQKQYEMEIVKNQNVRHFQEIEAKRLAKQNMKNEYSREYDRMIEYKRQRQAEEKYRSLELEKKMLANQRWLRDSSVEKEIEKQKKFQYGKELEKHLKLQQQKRTEEAIRIKEQRDKLKRQYQQQTKRQKLEQENKYKRRSMFQQRQNQILGVKDVMNWSQIDQKGQSAVAQKPLTPRMQRLLKVQQQKIYEKGLQVQYKNENQRRYFEKQNPERSRISGQIPESYNPITNPIPYRYKNPNILRMLSNKQ